MPSKSESQKRLFCMAYAVRKGKLKRSEVHQSVLDIVDGDMTDQEIKDYMVKECGLTEYIKESLYDTQYANGGSVKFKDPKFLLVIVKPQFLNHTAEIVKKEHPDAITVFVSPCVAKRAESYENPNVDYVMNYEITSKVAYDTAH